MPGMTDDELRQVLSERVAAVRGRIAAACARVARDPGSVTLIAVTKTVSPRVAGLLPNLGVLDLGENRPQELWRKAEALKHLPIRWHMIGHLQRNKIERTLPLVHMIHSVDSLRLWSAIQLEAQRMDHHPQLLLQMNISSEEQKQGFDYDELLALPEPDECGAVMAGLMGMAAYSDDPELARPAFAALRQFGDRLRDHWSKRIGPQMKHLSMGMSGDFEVAIEEGATMVRVGTTLFAGLEGE
jgi:pyridoxal phosphate enzyme (YggS family)